MAELQERLSGPNDMGSNVSSVVCNLIPFSSQMTMDVSFVANSLIRCRQPPQGVQSSSPYPTTAIAFMCLSPPAIIALIAPASAHDPTG